MVVKNRLKEILKAKGIKQSWLAEQIGMTKQSMSNLVNNRHQTSIDFAYKIACVLNMEMNDIWYSEEDTKDNQ